MNPQEQNMAPHLFKILRDLASDPESPHQVKKDWNTIERWLLDSGSPATPSDSFLSRSWQAYLDQGLAPSIKLQPAFDKSHNAAIASGYRLRHSVPPLEILNVFDRMLATDEEISKKRAVDYFAKAEHQSSPALGASSPKKREALKLKHVRTPRLFKGLNEGWRRVCLVVSAAGSAYFIYQAFLLQSYLLHQRCYTGCTELKTHIALQVLAAILTPIFVSLLARVILWIEAGFKRTG